MGLFVGGTYNALGSRAKLDFKTAQAFKLIHRLRTRVDVAICHMRPLQK